MEFLTPQTFWVWRKRGENQASRQRRKANKLPSPKANRESVEGSGTPAVEVRRTLSISTSAWGFPGLSISKNRTMSDCPTKPAFKVLFEADAT